MSRVSKIDTELVSSLSFYHRQAGSQKFSTFPNLNLPRTNCEKDQSMFGEGFWNGFFCVCLYLLIICVSKLYCGDIKHREGFIVP